MIPPRIKNVRALDNYSLEITYATNEKKIYDVKKWLNHNYYKNLNNVSYFKLVKSADVTVEWPKGEDIDPNELYDNGITINSND